jgi:SAM-dependent methyltransferase
MAAGDGAFLAVREFLQGSGYTEEFLLAHFQLPALHLLLRPFGMHGSYLGMKYQGEGLPLFVARLLMAGFPATVEEQERYLPDGVRAALLELGILEELPDGSVQSVVMVHPAYGFYVASDRGMRPSGAVYRGDDFVMSGAENLSRTYVEGFGKSPCDRLLEIGTGAGLGALVASRFAREVVATDITERAVEYAAFNLKLNGVTNVRLEMGDLFAPVAEEQFDRIVSHPPFEPSLKGSYVFSIGGEDGEAIIARLVREGVDRIAPGGRAYYQVTGSDRVDEPLEARVQQWLGDAAEDFDIALFVRISTTPREYATEQILAENEDAWKLMEWNVMYGKIKATMVLIGYLVLQRRAVGSERPAFVTRRVFGPKTGLAEMEWIVDWETRAAEAGFAERVLASRLGVGEGWQLFARHAMRDGQLATLSYTFFSKHPFETNLHCAGWMPLLVSQCDGKRTGAELLGQLQSRVPVREEEFVRAVGALAGMDVVRMLQ